MNIPKFLIEYLLYFYLFICGALLLYNILYIFSEPLRRNSHQRRIKYWQKEVGSVLADGRDTTGHRRKVEVKLRHLNYLQAYAAVLEDMAAIHGTESVNSYLSSLGDSFQGLCAYYGKRENMEKAYFAWFARRYHPYREEQTVFRQLLVGYLENSTVYCRENVLQALYASGDMEAVETALGFLSDRGIFHHKKLLSDGLINFNGDCQTLAWRLWSHLGHWNNNTITAVVQFCTSLSAAFQVEFLNVLESSSSDRELRFAILRYYRKFPYEPARECIQALALESEGEDLAIVAAFALDSYAGDDTVSVLEQALCSRNWYVRSNAAVSLLNLGAGQDTLMKLGKTGDAYAKDMLEYHLQKRSEIRGAMPV